MAKSKNLTVFYQFLTATRDTKSIKGRVELDSVDARILEELAVSWKDGTPITVVQMMTSVAFVSTTTAHRRLKSLRKNGLINLQLNEEDNRVKFIIPTEKALQHFEYLGRTMMIACKSEPKD